MTLQLKPIDWKLRGLATLVAAFIGGAIWGPVGALVQLAAFVIALTTLMYTSTHGYYLAFAVVALVTMATGFALHKVLDSPA